ncbi:MAG: gfo/Idh/MocA family oxidoreductase, partial [Proteobacteria bacterium]|nr:gfo/Idh/MocA family oxidoreductase [Pseudomonadota bacterium]
VEAIGVSVLSESVDIANARVTYPGGCVANLTASRVTPTPMRKLRFFQTDGYFSIDFLEQSALVLRRRTGDGESGADAREIEVETLDVDPTDAMEAQLRSFLQSVRTRKPSPANGPGSPGGACGALRTALRVIDAMPAADQLA